ncbi:MAG: hypothetical protein RR645_02145 [Clostridium sp.]
MNFTKITYTIFSFLEILGILLSLFILSTVLPIFPWYDNCGMQLLYMFLVIIIQLVVSLAFICINQKLPLQREILFHPLWSILFSFTPLYAVSLIGLPFKVTFSILIILDSILLFRVIFKTYQTLKS